MTTKTCKTCTHRQDSTPICVNCIPPYGNWESDKDARALKVVSDWIALGCTDGAESAGAFQALIAEALGEYE